MSSSSHCRVSRGFTLVELLVVISIIGVLIGLLFPAVGAVMNTVRTTSCRNNLAQLAKGLITYEGGHRTLPPGLASCMPTPATGSAVKNGGVSAGAVCQGPNWLSAILNEIEEKPLATQLSNCLDFTWNACDECSKAGGTGDKAWAPVGLKTPSIMVCPAAPTVGFALNNAFGLTGQLKGNYAGCFGMDTYISASGAASAGYTAAYKRTTLSYAQKSGVFEHVQTDITTTTSKDPKLARRGAKTAHNKGTPISYIVDGTSKTIMVSEIVNYDSALDGRGVWTFGGMGGSAFTGRNPPNSELPDNIPICDSSIVVPKKMVCTQVQTTAAYATARSDHSGGVNVAYADSNARYVSNDIAPEAWQALCTKNGGEPENPPD